MLKRDSKRRWKARARLGKAIPREVIVNYQLHHRMTFEPVDPYTEMYRLVTFDDNKLRTIRKCITSSMAFNNDRLSTQWDRIIHQETAA